MRGSKYRVSASDVGALMQSDMDLEFPTRPRLIPELLILPMGPNAVLFEGGTKSQVLSGGSARNQLVRISPHLDGSNTVDGLKRLLPELSESDITNTIALLHRSDLLEDGIEDSSDQVNLEASAYFGRFVGATRNNRNRGEAMRRLESARFGIVGPPHLAAVARQQLVACGVGSVSLDVDKPDFASSIDLLLVVDTGTRTGTESTMRNAFDSGAMVLYSTIGGDLSQVGPLLVKGLTGCVDCVIKSAVRPTGASETPLDFFWTAMVCTSAIHVAARAGTIQLLNSCDVYTNSSHGIGRQNRIFARSPGCESCGIEGSPKRLSAEALQLWQEHEAGNSPPIAFDSKRSYQNHFLPQNILAAKSLPEGATRNRVINLETPVGHNSLDSPSGDSAIDTGILSQQLYFAAGYHERDGDTWRIAPTGGSLGSPELYVIANGLASVGDGVYFYHGPSHTLQFVSDLEVDAIQECLDVPTLSAVTIVGVGNLSRLRKKYQDFSLRLACADAGVARAYLRLSVEDSKYRLYELGHTQKADLLRKLRLGPVGDPCIILFAMALWPTGSVNDTDGTFGEDDGLFSCDGVGDGDATKLFDAFLERRSTRNFSLTAVPYRSLIRIADAVHDTIRHPYYDFYGIKAWWFVRSGTGELPSGVYQSDPRGHFGHVQAVPGHIGPGDLVVQGTLGQAPVLLILTSNLGGAIRVKGEDGYCESIVCVGEVLACGMIEAQLQGVASCVTMGIRAAGVRSLTGIDGFNDSPVAGLALGQHHAK